LINRIAALDKEMVIAPGHHGKFLIDHFHGPITTTIDNFSLDAVFKMKKDAFVDFAVSNVNALPRPPSYQTILQINAGKLQMSEEQITELEIGPNRCAMG